MEQELYDSLERDMAPISILFPPYRERKTQENVSKTFLSWPVACVFFGTDSCHPFPCQLSLRAVGASLAFLSPRCLCLMLENPNSSSYLKSFVYQLQLVKVKGRS